MLGSIRKIAFLVAAILTPMGAMAADVYSLTTNYPSENKPAGICLGDLRGNDLFRDMAVANYDNSMVSVRLCLDNGTFGGNVNYYPVDLNPIDIIYLDVDRDGDDDLATANFGTNTVSVLKNLGVGANFAPATNYVVGTTTNPGPRSLCRADVDRDGHSDLLVANYYETNVTVLYGLGGGVFGSHTNLPSTNYTVGNGPSSIIAFDMNGDQRPDAVVANSLDGTLTILPGQTNGTFGAAQTIPLTLGGDPICVMAGDFNGDDVFDLVTANYNDGTIAILVGEIVAGAWTVAYEYEMDVGLDPISLSVRDFNRDELLDIAVVNRGDGNVEVFFGDGIGGFVPQGTYDVGDDPRAIAGSNFNSDDTTDFAVVNYGDDNVSILLFAGPVAYNVITNVNEDSQVMVRFRGSLLNGGPLIYLTNSVPLYGTLSNPTLTNVLYTPGTNFWGSDSFTYYAVDTNTALTSSVATVTINVHPVNDPPGFDISATEIQVWEDAPTTTIPFFATNLVEGPPNETNQSLTFVVTTTSTTFFVSKPQISPAGTLTFRPARNVIGTHMVMARLKDSGGTLRGGTNISEPKLFVIVINPNPIKPLAGLYNGLFYDTNGVNHPSSGFFTFTMKSSGAFSGKLTGDTGKYPFTGQFDLATGQANGVSVLRNGPTLYLDLQLDLTNSTDEVIGTVTDGVWVSDLLGDRLAYNTTTNPAPQVGRYTLAIPGGTDAAASAGGDSYATITVASNGTLKATGKLSDGTTLSQSTYLSKNGDWPFYLSLYNAQGSALGWIKFTNTISGCMTGAVSWIKPASFVTYYPNGFTNLTSVLGSTYVQPTNTGEHILPMTNGLFIVSGGNLLAPVTNSAVLTDSNNVVVNNANVLRVNNALSGTMIGSFTHPSLNSSRALNGVVLQQQNQARGYFLGTNQSGAFLLLPND